MESFYAQNKDVRLLTYRNPKKQVKLGKVFDHCRKVSQDIFIVREDDKVKGKHHYHALMIMQKEPPIGWYTKGVHIDLKKVGRPQTNVGLVVPMPGLTTLEKLEMISEEPANQRFVESDHIEQTITKSLQKTNRDKHVERVVRYLNKEQTDESIQYVDYILYIKGKHIKRANPDPEEGRVGLGGSDAPPHPSGGAEPHARDKT